MGSNTGDQGALHGAYPHTALTEGFPAYLHQSTAPQQQQQPHHHLQHQHQYPAEKGKRHSGFEEFQSNASSPYRGEQRQSSFSPTCSAPFSGYGSPLSGALDSSEEADMPKIGSGDHLPNAAKRAGGSGMTTDELKNLDPRRVKRILANRLSAARSKERKMRYIHDLEAKVSALQNDVNVKANLVRMLHQDALALGNSNAALFQQAVTMQQHARRRDNENAMLLEELRKMQYMTGIPVQIPDLAPPLQQQAIAPPKLLLDRNLQAAVATQNLAVGQSPELHSPEMQPQPPLLASPQSASLLFSHSPSSRFPQGLPDLSVQQHRPPDVWPPPPQQHLNTGNSAMHGNYLRMAQQAMQLARPPVPHQSVGSAGSMQSMNSLHDFPGEDTARPDRAVISEEWANDRLFCMA